MQKVKEKEKLLKMYNLPRLNQEGIEHINRLTTSNEIESVIATTQDTTRPASQEYCQTFKEDLTPILLKLLQKN